jgi:hypothetical protein
VFSAFDSLHYNVLRIVVLHITTGFGKTKSGRIHRCPPFPVPFTTKPKTKYLNNKIPKLGTLKNQGVCYTMALPFYNK